MKRFNSVDKIFDKKINEIWSKQLENMINTNLDWIEEQTKIREAEKKKEKEKELAEIRECIERNDMYELSEMIYNMEQKIKEKDRIIENSKHDLETFNKIIKTLNDEGYIHDEW